MWGTPPNGSVHTPRQIIPMIGFIEVDEVAEDDVQVPVS